MICSISGNPTSFPVFSPVSGHIYDRSLVEKYVQQHGTDPINDQPLKVEDLITVNEPEAAVTATPNNLTSIPNLLSQFQKEWDALAIEMLTLRKQLKESREELSVALYHQDAAVRVAAKAVQERDEAKKALEELSSSIAKGDYNAITPDEDEDVAGEGEREEIQQDMDDETAAQIQEAHAVLFAEHKANKQKASFSADSKLSLSVNDTFDFHTVLKDLTGFKTSMITGVSVHPHIQSQVLITFDNDHAVVYDTEAKELIAKLAPKKKKLMSAAWLQDFPALAFQDGTIVIDGNVLKSSKGLQHLVTHPSLPLVIAFQASSFQIFNGQKLAFSAKTDYVISSAAIHGDGQLLALGGDDGVIHIHDLCKGVEVASLQGSDGWKVSSLKFASNGYWLIAQLADGATTSLKVYDLRKESCVFETQDANFLAIDPSSQLIYLAKHSSDKIQLSFLRYHKKLKTFQLGHEEPLHVDDVAKLKKNNRTHIVGAYHHGENLVLVENSNVFKTVQLEIVQ